RWFFLLQDDSLSFGDVNRPDNRKNNLYTKVGYQYGTQFDERMNAIVGEQRGRITPVLTAFREIGPQKTGIAAAVTQSAGTLGGDYTYTRFEAEGLRRFDLTSTSDRSAAVLLDRKSTRLNSSHVEISYAVFCLKKKNDRLLVQ